MNSVEQWNVEDTYVFGAFSRKEHDLCGYVQLTERGKVIHFNILKSCPDHEKYGVNAALVYGFLQEFMVKLQTGSYVCDGERNILHQTNFQNYLEKYFAFRKAYCKLNVKFNLALRLLVPILYVFKIFFRKLDDIALIHKINGVLLMYEIVNEQKCEDRR